MFSSLRKPIGMTSFEHFFSFSVNNNCYDGYSQTSLSVEKLYQQRSNKCFDFAPSYATWWHHNSKLIVSQSDVVSSVFFSLKDGKRNPRSKNWLFSSCYYFWSASLQDRTQTIHRMLCLYISCVPRANSGRFGYWVVTSRTTLS